MAAFRSCLPDEALEKAKWFSDCQRILMELEKQMESKFYSTVVSLKLGSKKYRRYQERSRSVAERFSVKRFLRRCDSEKATWYMRLDSRKTFLADLDVP